MELQFALSQQPVALLRSAAERYADGHARVAVAWARDGGVRWFLDALGGRIAHIEAVIGINERGTTAEALYRFLQAGADVSVFLKHPRQTFHPKVYWLGDAADYAGRNTLFVGSSNLTTGGLTTNYEASLLVRVNEGETNDEGRALLAVFRSEWDSLLESKFRHSVESDDDIKALLDEKYISVERQLRRRLRKVAKAEGQAGTLPLEPPPPSGAPPLEDIELPFPVEQEDDEDGADEEEVEGGAGPEGGEEIIEVPGDEAEADLLYYVRTLTLNDVRKLRGEQTGTFEPDIGLMARDAQPEFWGWPDDYTSVVHKDPEKPRDEWAATALLSASVEPDGVEVESMLWHREAREGHPAEHRIRLGPIGEVRAAVPPDFDTGSLMVVSRSAVDGVDFDVRLLTQDDEDYAEFAEYLSVQRPAHRWGYSD